MPSKRKSPSSASTSTSANGAGKAKKAAKAQAAASEEGVIPMGRQLASTEKKTRDAAIRSLSLYLTQQSSSPSSSSSLFSSPLEIAKLWKGIFYCFWMSDKPLVQQALAQELSDLLLAVGGEDKVPAPRVGGFEDSVGEVSVKVHCGLALFEGFADVMVREWSGLDKWRVDKFYLLIRRFVNAALRLLAETAWDPTSISHFSRILTKQGGLLCPNDQRVPDSLTYHFTDVFLTDLEKVCSASVEDDQSSRGPVELLLRPIVRTAATCHSKTVYDKIMRNIVQPLDDDLLLGVKTRRRQQQEDGDEEEEEKEREFPSIPRASSLQSEVKFRAHLYKIIFEEASSQDALPPNRRKMYAYFQKETDRKEVEDEDDSDEDDEE